MRILLALSLATVCSAARDSHPEVYRAELTEIPGTASGVTGVAYVFTAGDGMTIGYAGFASGAQPLLEASTCNATNGCGAHVHSGTSCADKEGQGGHYFVAANDSAVEPQTTEDPDPWLDVRYSSDENGDATFSGALDIGSDNVEGRAFVFHNEDGSRAGCGLLMKVPESELLETATSELKSSGVSGHVVAHPVETGSDHVCFFAKASGLERNIISYQMDPISEECTSTNGCGLHFHSGTSCENSTTQGGHLYDETVVPEDPWLTVGYLSTDANGNGYHADCVVTGVTEFVGRPFVFHANDGGRVACGVVEQMSSDGHNDEQPDQTSAAGTARTFASLSAVLLVFLAGLM